MDIFFGILLIIIAIIVSYYGYMLLFMGLVFLFLSILKLIDIKGFAMIFKKYDPLAKTIPFYAEVYPFLELFIALCFLFKFLITTAAIITIIIMSVGSYGIIKKIISKDDISCACLGAKIHVPLTRFTLIEDILMALMALVLLF
ncbi:MAG: hypothetical protein S4CHLAM20_01480 [Chlamydiia bacterium]|nr:hypothetical protein [Chlamydiia bacterium]